MRRHLSLLGFLALSVSGACAAQHAADEGGPDSGALPEASTSMDATSEASTPRADADATPDAVASDGAPPILDGGAPEGSLESDAPIEDAGLGIDCTTEADHPVELGCTGLYSSWPSRTISASVRPFTPGLALWSDGMEKQRYIELPPGTQIDTSNMDEWTFPVGTKLWKEFDYDGTPVETRFLWKTAASTWFRTTYVWSSDGSSATEVTTGIQGVPGVNGGTYEVPTQAMCTTCHQGRIDGVLGFEAVSLAAPGATGLTLSELEAENLLTDPPSTPPVVPGDATASAAIGWLHGNCGTACHNPSPNSLANATGLYMRLDVATLASVQTTYVWTTAVGQPSDFQPYPDSGLLLIDPGDPGNSCIYFRDSTRDDAGQGFQMPPIDTHVVPTAGVALVQAWIQAIGTDP